MFLRQSKSISYLKALIFASEALFLRLPTRETVLASLLVFGVCTTLGTLTCTRLMNVSYKMCPRSVRFGKHYREVYFLCFLVSLGYCQKKCEIKRLSLTISETISGTRIDTSR